MTDTPQRTDQDILEIARSETYAGFEYLRALRTGQERDDDAKVVNRKTQSIHVIISAYAKLISALAVKGSGDQPSPEQQRGAMLSLLRSPPPDFLALLDEAGIVLVRKELPP